MLELDSTYVNCQQEMLYILLIASGLRGLQEFCLRNCLHRGIQSDVDGERQRLKPF